LGENKYVQGVTGLVSYLNREFDVRQFAQPTITYLRDKDMSSKVDIEKTELDVFRKVNEQARMQKLKALNEMDVFNKKQKDFSHLCDVLKTAHNKNTNTTQKTNKTRKKGDSGNKAKYESCKKLVKNAVTDLLERIKKYKDTVIQEYKLAKNGKLQGDDRYKLSIYYNLLTKCQKALDKKHKEPKTLAKTKESKDLAKLNHPPTSNGDYEINIRTEEIGKVKEEIQLIREEIREIQKIKTPTKETDQMLHMLEKNLVHKEDYLVFIQEEIEFIKKELADIQREKEKLEKQGLKENGHFKSHEISKITIHVNSLVDQTISELNRRIQNL